MNAELLIVSDVSGQADAAGVEMLSRQSMVVVGDLVLEKIPAHLSVDEEVSIARSRIGANERDLQVVAKSRRAGIETGRSGILRRHAQVADRRTDVQIPAVHVQPGKVGADLNAGEIFPRARIASNFAARDRPAKAYVSSCCDCAGTEVAANAAGPHAAALLVRLRIGRTADECTG